MSSTLPEGPILPMKTPGAFEVLSQTQSTQPFQLQPGDVFEVEARVENESETVDSFQLACSNLPTEFYTVSYPGPPELLGILSVTEALELQPDEQGTIEIAIHPPPHTPAGNYCLLLSVVSAQGGELGRPEAVHFHLPSAQQLAVSLSPPLGNVRDQPGKFQLRLQNQGNMERHLILHAQGSWEQQDFCTYRLEPDFVQLAPGDQTDVALEVKPMGQWRRPFWGEGRPLDFTVGIKDLNNPSIPEQVAKGTVIWEPYASLPGWRWSRSLLLGIGGGLCAIALCGWWFWLKPSGSPTPQIMAEQGAEQPLNVGGAELEEAPVATTAAPQILKFYSPRSVYQATLPVLPQLPAATTAAGASPPPAASSSALNQNPILLNWEIANPSQVKELQVIGLAPNGVPTSPLQRYRLVDNQLPQALQTQCTLTDTLVCVNVPTTARIPGEHFFRLTVIPKQGQQSTDLTQTTEKIRIEPPQSPSVANLNPRPNPVPTPIRENSQASLANRQPLGNGRNLTGPTARLPQRFIATEPRATPPTSAIVPAQRRPAPTQPVTSRSSLIRPPQTVTNSRVTVSNTRRPVTQPRTPTIARRSLMQPRTPTIARRPVSPPVSTAAARTTGQDANALVRGLSVAYQQGKINPNGQMWRRVQTAVQLLQQGSSREAAARRAGVPLSVLNILIANGEWQSSN